MPYIEYADHNFEDPLPKLARANGFTMADLDQNRNGKINDTQWMPLVLRALKPVFYTGGALAGWLFFCVIVRAVVPRIILLFLAMKGIGIALVGGVTLACVGAFLVSVIKCARTMSLLLVDLNIGKAACIEGRVSPSRQDEGGLGLARLYGETNTKFWYVVKNEYFEVDHEAHGALPERVHFRLYYTPKSKLLLSIEPKSADNADDKLSRASTPGVTVREL
jgi:hypothetical protein